MLALLPRAAIADVPSRLYQSGYDESRARRVEDGADQESGDENDSFIIVPVEEENQEEIANAADFQNTADVQDMPEV